MKHFKTKLMYSCFPVLQTGPYLTSPRTTIKLIPNTSKKSHQVVIQGKKIDLCALVHEYNPINADGSLQVYYQC